MKKNLLNLILLLLVAYGSNAQQVIFDFEPAGTTTNFQYFGSSLDGTLASNIANPNPTGVNQSATVLEYVKAANSETWAGAFANPGPAPINCVNGGTICIDVHMDHIGVLALKLEQSSTGGSNWLTTQPNTVVNQWETLCFDLSANGLEDAMTPAAGHIFNQIVIFPDFGSNDVSDVTYYIDNMILNTTTTTEMSDVVFSVNMGEKTDFTTVYLSGEFNDWSGEANPMNDDDGDNIWTTTINVLNGTYEYKFSLDNWTQSEQFDGTDVCTVTTEDGQFTNRVVTIVEDIDLGPVCYASCYNCGESVNITWNLNMNNEDVSDLGVYIAGGQYFGHGDLPSMTDDDGDGIYTITLEREMGFTTDYTFLNGLCLPDWSCKENIEGQPCAVAPFNDRNLAPVMGDMEINTCFGVCSTDGTCNPVGTEDLDFDAELFQVRPSVTSDYAEIIWNGNEDRLIYIYSVSGQLVKTYNVPSYTNVQRIDANNFGSGLYVIRMTTETKVGSQKLVIR